MYPPDEQVHLHRHTHAGMGNILTKPWTDDLRTASWGRLSLEWNAPHASRGTQCVQPAALHWKRKQNMNTGRNVSYTEWVVCVCVCICMYVCVCVCVCVCVQIYAFGHSVGCHIALMETKPYFHQGNVTADTMAESKLKLNRASQWEWIRDTTLKDNKQLFRLYSIYMYNGQSHKWPEQ